MKERNNEINIKINLSDDLLSALANVFVMANMRSPLQAVIQQKPTTGIPSSPVGFRIPTESGNE